MFMFENVRESAQDYTLIQKHHCLTCTSNRKEKQLAIAIYYLYETIKITFGIVTFGNILKAKTFFHFGIS